MSLGGSLFGGSSFAGPGSGAGQAAPPLPVIVPTADDATEPAFVLVPDPQAAAVAATGTGGAFPARAFPSRAFPARAFPKPAGSSALVPPPPTIVPAY